MNTLLQRRLKHDPKEDDPKYRDIIKQAETEANELVDREYPDASLGRCHAVWAEQKRILKEKHGIDWQSPRDLNKYARFD